MTHIFTRLRPHARPCDPCQFGRTLTSNSSCVFYQTRRSQLISLFVCRDLTYCLRCVWRVPVIVYYWHKETGTRGESGRSQIVTIKVISSCQLQYGRYRGIIDHSRGSRYFKYAYAGLLQLPSKAKFYRCNLTKTLLVMPAHATFHRNPQKVDVFVWYNVPHYI